ncbi:MAG: ABC transporter ATP-binding protein [Thermoplasmata archaeon]|nr:ABC transporter ATP-binding protein [Thermoplasmata archaeon]
MMERRAPRVALKGVTKLYGGGEAEPVRALAEANLTIEPGSFVAIEGPSGCGKTTLLNLLGLIDVPSAGEILWDDVRVEGLKERERARRRLHEIGFVFQRFHLIPTLTAQENVELPLRARGVRRGERADRARELLDQVGLTARAPAFPHQLSGGEEQRVAIARALANRPRQLLADEPTGELDSANAAQVLALLKELHRGSGASLVLVTHNPAIASEAEQRIRMADGRIVPGGAA